MKKRYSKAFVYVSDGEKFRILKSTKKTRSGPRDYYLLAESSTGKRRILNHTSLAAAQKRADDIRKAMSRGVANRLAYSQNEWTDICQARSALKSAYPRMSMTDAVRELVESRRALEDGVSLVQAVASYREQKQTTNEPNFIPTLLENAAAAYLHAKQRQNKSASHCKNIECRFKRLAGALPVGVRVHELTAGQLEDAVASLGLGPKTFNDYRLMLVNFFSWCRKQNPALVPPNTNPAQAMDQQAEVHGEVQFLTSAQLRTILTAAEAERPDLLPYLTLVAFAGLRPAEATRLDWSEMKGQYIRLPGSKSKTGRSRQIPIQPNLASWLACWRQPKGPVCPDIDLHHVNAQIRRISGITMPHDGLRHGYGTHRRLIVQNVNTVAMEMGNQLRICERHYVNQFCTEEEAKEWFSLIPTRDANGVVANPARETALPPETPSAYPPPNSAPTPNSLSQ